VFIINIFFDKFFIISQPDHYKYVYKHMDKKSTVLTLHLIYIYSIKFLKKISLPHPFGTTSSFWRLIVDDKKEPCWFFSQKNLLFVSSIVPLFLYSRALPPPLMYPLLTTVYMNPCHIRSNTYCTKYRELTVVLEH
jgi:hypothetical protein